METKNGREITKGLMAAIIIIVLFLLVLIGMIVVIALRKVNVLPQVETPAAQSTITISNDPNDEKEKEPQAPEVPVDESDQGFNTKEYLESTKREYEDGVHYNGQNYLDLPNPDEYDVTLNKDDVKSGEQTKQVGQMTVTFNGDHGYGESGEVAKMAISGVLFNDGVEGLISGGVEAINASIVGKAGYPTSIDNAKDWVSEYIADSSGVLAEWEEDEYYFVRKCTMYDNELKTAIIYLNAVPKASAGDSNMYSAYLTMYGDNENGTPMLESTFNSIMDPLKQLIPDSYFANQTYEAICSELQFTMFYRAGDGSAYGNMNALRNARNQYMQDVYGVSLDGSTDKKIGDLTEEEMKDLYWSYTDPVGYAQAHAETESRHAEDEPADPDGPNYNDDPSWDFPVYEPEEGSGE